MDEKKTQKQAVLGTLVNEDASGIIAYSDQIYDKKEEKSVEDIGADHEKRVKQLETWDGQLQDTIENITKTGEASAASNVAYNHNDSQLDASNVQQAVDEVYKKSNYNDGDEIIDFNSVHIIKKSDKYVLALIDDNENLIVGILRENGHIVYGNGIPDEVKDYIDEKINQILGTEDITSTIDSLKEVEDFLKDFSNSDNLKALLDYQTADIEDKYKRSNPNDEEGNVIDTKDVASFVKSARYYKVVLDGNGNIIEAILSENIIKDYLPRSIQGNLLYSISDKHYIWALLDSNENLIVGARRDNGEIVYGNGLPSETKDAIESAISYTDNEITNVKTLVDKVYETLGIKGTDGKYITRSSIYSVVESSKYSEVKTDSNGNIVCVRYRDSGIVEHFLPVKIQGVELKVVSNKKYLIAIIDSNENIALALTRDNADVIFGGDSLREIVSRLNIVDSNGNPITFSDFFSVITSKKYGEIKKDANDNILYALDIANNIFRFFLPISVQGIELSTISNDRYVLALLDANENLVIGIKREDLDIEFGGGIPSAISDALKSLDISSSLSNYATKEYADNGKITDTERQSIEDYNLPVPSYYKDYLAERIAKINETILNNEGYNDSFIFITDCHTPSNSMQSPKLIKYILANTTLNKVFYGGDTPAAYGTKDDIYNTALRYLQNFYKAIQPYGHLYSAVGNHDFTIRTSSTESTGYTFPRQFGRNVYMGKHRIGDGVVTNEADSGAAYYYVDNADEKVRYVVVNTTDVSNAGENAWATSTALSQVQMDWIANTALKKCPTDYKVVIIGHIPPMRAVNATNGIQLSHWANMITAAKNKTTVTIGSSTYDFMGVADIEFTIWGHEHQDEQTFANNIPWIVSACDAYYVDYRHAMFGNADDYSYKTKGTVYEQTFDIVNLDFNSNIANLIRIGGGFDRKIHLEVQTVKVGNTLSLNSGIDTPTWDIADGTGNTQDTTTWAWTKNTNVATVDNGAVTALKAGYATACAYNSSTKEMELWGIEVTE